MPPQYFARACAKVRAEYLFVGVNLMSGGKLDIFLYSCYTKHLAISVPRST
jgi:hypothetical protein